jgi:hypothetical protein
MRLKLLLHYRPKKKQAMRFVRQAHQEILGGITTCFFSGTPRRGITERKVFTNICRAKESKGEDGVCRERGRGRVVCEPKSHQKYTDPI